MGVFRRTHAPCRCSSSTIAIRTRSSAIVLTLSRRVLKLVASSRSSRGLTCVPGIRTGTSRSPTCTTRTRRSSRPAMASRSIGISSMGNAGSCGHGGSRRPRSSRRSRRTSAGPSSGWRRSVHSSTAPPRRPSSRRSSASTAPGSNRENPRSRYSTANGGQPRRHCSQQQGSRPVGLSRASRRSPAIPTRSMRSGWQTARWPRRCADVYPRWRSPRGGRSSSRSC